VTRSQRGGSKAGKLGGDKLTVDAAAGS